ncbi:MAG TPA: glycosyltransferase [Cyclobacteriaceae bacterium]|nr:glycosyltransferase [Cyclobacteriaceae bacterium]
MKPLVSVICVCYNHERFVEEAIDSVLSQKYARVELVVIDDKSHDNSVSRIRKALARFPETKIIVSDANRGNCKAFNEGFRNTKGDLIIDLSADDVLFPDRIAKGVENFQTWGPQIGVNFTDAVLIDEEGRTLGYHSDRFPHETIPQGDIYREVLSRYFINSPTMMIRRNVLERLGGYDETLAYEDFDFWVRSSRDFHYAYTPEPLVKRRIVKDSLGSKQFKKGSAQLQSTYQVCEKAMILNKTQSEKNALKGRIRYEIGQALKLGELQLAWRYMVLYAKV